jgi:hypothetical protein
MMLEHSRKKHGTRLISLAKKRKQIKNMKGDQVTLETSHEKKIIEFEEKGSEKKEMAEAPSKRSMQEKERALK